MLRVRHLEACLEVTQRGRGGVVDGAVGEERVRLARVVNGPVGLVEELPLVVLEPAEHVRGACLRSDPRDEQRRCTRT